MRSLQFKTWDRRRKRFAKQITTFKFDRNGNINLVVYLDKVNKTKEILDIDKIFCNEFEIVEYINFKDKNGNKIYRGDILKINMSDSDAKDYTGDIFEIVEVIFEDGCYKLRNDSGFVFDIYFCERGERISSVFEELGKQKEKRR